MLLCLFLLISTSVADPIADSAPGPGGGPVAGEALYRPPLEWSTWVRAAYVIGSGAEQTPVARSVTPPAPASSNWQFALGADLSLPLSVRGNVRLGGWVELRGTERADAFAGGELVFTAVPRRLDMFLYEGSGMLALRAGRSSEQQTASVAFGYLAPWWLEGRCRVRFFDVATGVCTPRAARTSRYMVGVRLVATATRAIVDDRAWSLAVGIEVEPLGALRTLGIRSWY